MKNKLEIILRTIHFGDARRVVTLDLGEGAPADEFFSKLRRSNREGFGALAARIRSISHYDRYQNPLTFKS